MRSPRINWVYQKHLSTLIFGILILSHGSIAHSISAGAAQTSNQSPESPKKKSDDKTPSSDSITGIVLDAGGRPASGISVVLMTSTYTMENSRFTQNTKTDEKGRFFFEGLPDRAFRVLTKNHSSSSLNELYVPGDYVTIRMEKGGVITGTVIGFDGSPVVHLPVYLQRVRRLDGKPMAFREAGTSQQMRRTDDRGVYRIWDVQPGIYLVRAGGEHETGYGRVNSQYTDEAPTYYPSSTLASATQVTVNPGQEVSGIDIRYHGESGFAISGVIATGGLQSTSTSDQDVGAALFTSTRQYLGESTSIDGTHAAFIFNHLSDGDYKIIAYVDTDDVMGVSLPQSISIRGSDVTSITLKVLPVATISGRITLDLSTDASCKTNQKRTLEEVVLALTSDNPEDVILRAVLVSLLEPASPRSNGEFSLSKIAGNYRVKTWLPSEDWYIANMTIPPSAKSKDISVGLSLKSGQKVSGLSIALKAGAASLSGQIIPTATGNQIPDGLQVFLIPAEASRVDEHLRFANSAVQPDGSFKLANLAPGAYRILARPLSKEETERPITDTHDGRVKLMREAEQKSVIIDLHSCERQVGYKLKYDQGTP